MIAVFGEKINAKLFYLRVDAQSLPVRLEFVNQLPRFEHWVMDAKFLNADDYLALGLSDNSVAFWDVAGLTMMGG
ncbi:hypothetical protein KSP39_PZI000624 [Platanthera zijinensis]|uniref:Uncharacterized protein n=1 Tax=Platanthera zijinensis TaxID=2320716 RepID=A0AAP0C065_9ASPA